MSKEAKIMRNIHGILFFLLLTAACQKNEIPQDDKSLRLNLVAVSEDVMPAIRAVVDLEEGYYVWESGDKIRVFTNSSSTVKSLTLLNHNYNAYFTYSADLKFAVSPSDLSVTQSAGQVQTIALPDTYNNYQSGKAFAPMYADFPEGYDYNATHNPDVSLGPNEGIDLDLNKNINFKHLCGLMKVEFKSVPAGINQMVFTADKNITGAFTVATDSEGYKTLVAGDGQGSGSTVTFNFTALDAPGPMTFYVPLPLGQYDGFRIELKNTASTTGECVKEAVTKGRQIARRTLALMPATYPDYQSTVEGDKAVYTVSSGMGLMRVRELINALPTDVKEVTLNFSENSVINMVGYNDWKPIAVSGRTNFTIEGNGSTIKGISRPLVGPDFSGDLNISRLTIADSKLLPMAGKDQDLGIGLFVMHMEHGKSAKFNDCHAKNITINEDGIGYIAGMISYTSQASISIEDCSLEGCRFTGTGTVGGFVGLASQDGKVFNNCTVSDCEFISNSSSFYSVGIIGGVLNAGCEATVTNLVVSGNVVKQENAFIESDGDNYDWGGLYGTVSDRIDYSLCVDSKGLFGFLVGTFTRDGEVITTN